MSSRVRARLKRCSRLLLGRKRVEELTGRTGSVPAAITDVSANHERRQINPEPQ